MTGASLDDQDEKSNVLSEVASDGKHQAVRIVVDDDANRARGASESNYALCCSVFQVM